MEAKTTQTRLPPDLPQRDEAEQEAFFTGMRDLALAAGDRAGVVEHWFDIAGCIVRVAFAGHALADLFVGALAHLRTAPVPRPAATLHVWDTASTGVEALLPPCTRAAFTDRGDIWGFASERFRSAFHWAEFSVALMDTGTGEGVYWVQAAEDLPYWAKASPMRTLFHWLMERTGRQLLHAAAVGDANGAVLITGKGGVGKSTMALACLGAGMCYIGDDYIVIGLEPEPRVYSLYNTAKLAVEHMAVFPGLAAQVSNHGSGDEKSVLSLHPDFDGQIVRSLPLRAVLTPRISPVAETSFVPIATAVLARAAAFTTLSQLPHAGRRTQAVIDTMLDHVPGLEVRVGSDLDQIPSAVRGLLAHSLDELKAMASDAAATAVRHRPLVSVIIPTFNGAHFLPDAIASVLRQHYPALEIIVVDDASSDEIEVAVQALPVDVRFFRQEYNMGPAAARNRGIKDASGELIAFLDVDDMWTDNNLHTMADALMADPALDVALAFGQLVYPNPRTGELVYMGSPDESFPYYIGCGLYRREVFRRIGLFDESLRFGEDLDWYNRANETGLRIEVIRQVALLVRRHGGNMTHGKSLVELNKLRVFKKALDRRRAAQRP